MVQATFRDIATRSPDDALRLLASSASHGLPPDEAARRLAEYGANELTATGATAMRILLRQFRSSFIYLLCAASVIALALGESLDAAVIFLFLVINAGLGFYQEYRAEHALQLLKQFVERRTRLRRGGVTIGVPVREVVPGDIVLLSAGDMMPADGCFLRADDVAVDESPMTGESAPVAKVSGPLSAAPKDFYGATNIGFARTTLVAGTAELLVIATGARTAVGELASSMQAADAPSAFELGVSRFSAFILKLVGVTVPLVYLLHAIVTDSGVSAGEFLLFSIALTVSAIPEALPLVTTISLSRGALALAKQHVVPRRLSAIEDLGSIDVLATDKTGTITENSLSVAGVYGERRDVLRHALLAPLARTGANAQDQGYDAAIRAADEGEARAPWPAVVLLDEMPFDPVRKRATVLVRVQGAPLVVSRGAPERLYAGAADEAAALAWAAVEGQKGRRVLAVAWKEDQPPGRRRSVPATKRA